MGRKLLSFLGTTKYLEAYYHFNGEKSGRACQFILEALFQFFCRDWGSEDGVIVFLTEESKRKNWLSKAEDPDANFDIGLREALEKCGVNVDFKSVEIPEGRNEEELWEIFEKINEAIQEEDNVLFDITQFSLPPPIDTDCSKLCEISQKR